MLHYELGVAKLLRLVIRYKVEGYTPFYKPSPSYRSKVASEKYRAHFLCSVYKIKVGLLILINNISKNYKRSFCFLASFLLLPLEPLLYYALCQSESSLVQFGKRVRLAAYAQSVFYVVPYSRKHGEYGSEGCDRSYYDKQKKIYFI